LSFFDSSKFSYFIYLKILAVNMLKYNSVLITPENFNFFHNVRSASGKESLPKTDFGRSSFKK
jgi:hypothetical protein